MATRRRTRSTAKTSSETAKKSPQTSTVRKAHRPLDRTSRTPAKPSSSAEARLREYRKKRDFAITAEPSPDSPHESHGRGDGEFVIQKHDATRLHYDVRIEIDGAMMSWAVPKGPSLDPAVKRLAVETEDHPMAYNAFEGRIPDGEYGAGDVLIWDRGRFETVPPGQAAAMRAKGHLHLRFFGEKLRGDWHVVRTGRPSSKPQWLLFKAKDAHADPARDVVVERPESVVSGRSALRGPVRKSKRSAPSAAKLAEKVGEVEKATLVRGLDDPDEYRFEIKYDGYRILAAKLGGEVKLTSRNGHDWTEPFRPIADALARLSVDEAIFDGEVCALDAAGRPSFHRLQNWMGGADAKTALTYAIFDLLWLDGRDLRRLPLEERRELLEPLIAGGAQWTRGKGKGEKAGARGPLSLSASVAADGRTAAELLAVACAQGLEGLIAKRKGSPYIEGRTRDWLKLKCEKRQELAIVGYVPMTGTTDRVGALLLATADDAGRFHFAGKVGTGFDARVRKELAAALDRARTENSPADGAPKLRVAHWSKPALVAEIRFTEWTPDGKIRHPSFLGLRADKSPRECTREVAAPPPATKRGAKSKSKSKRASTLQQSSAEKRPASKSPSKAASRVGLTNPDKVLYPRDGLTKRDVVDYLTAVAPAMLPHLRGRPIALQRWPHGIHGEAWYQQRAAEKRPEFVHGIDVGGRTQLLVENVETLQWLGNLAALTLHAWSSHAPTLDVPDYVVFDLDPGDGTWAQLIEVADALHRSLDGLELPSFVKTSGKRGLHVLVPLAPKAKPTHDAVTAFAGSLAEAIARALPQVATVERMKASRGGRLYVDYLQNGRGKTIVAPYSLRALDGAPVSTPLEWSEVTTKLRPAELGIREVLRRLEKKGDPWATMLPGAARLPRLQ